MATYSVGLSMPVTLAMPRAGASNPTLATTSAVDGEMNDTPVASETAISGRRGQREPLQPAIGDRRLDGVALVGIDPGQDHDLARVAGRLGEAPLRTPWRPRR